MLLTITTTYEPATDLGYLLHKNPARHQCQQRPELVATPLPLEVGIEVLPCRGGEGLLHDVFGPLGYEVTAAGFPLDELFPDWGQSPYYSVRLSKTATLAEVLTHLYVLIPVCTF